MKTAMNRLKAEAFDIMQCFYGTVHEPSIHCLIHLAGKLDEDILADAVTASLAAAPMIRCGFITEGERPYWEERKLSGSDIVELIETDEISEQRIAGLLSTHIQAHEGPQLKIFLIRGQGSDMLCTIMNHMVCDGSGFKEYLYLLCDIYSRMVMGHDTTTLTGGLPRSGRQLYRHSGLKRKLEILTSRYNVAAQKAMAGYPLTGDRSNPLFVVSKLDREGFTGILKYAKARNVSVNDLFLTAYIYVFSKKTGLRRIVMPCPVDLRRYLAPETKTGICNLTSNFFCDIETDGKSFEDILTEVSVQIRCQSPGEAVLKSVMSAEIFFHLPFDLVKKLFSLVFSVPKISYTNFGMIDKEKAVFAGTEITDFYLTGAVKTVPYFQIAVSTFDGEATLSCNLWGTTDDHREAEAFLNEMKALMLSLN